MTAEIAILNKIGVALAADSAITGKIADSRKPIYVSDHKIFQVSQAAPVGILIHGKSEFMGIPIETLVKEYITKHGDTDFKNLEGYADKFLTFLSDEVPLHVAPHIQDQSLLNTVRHVFESMNRHMRSRFFASRTFEYGTSWDSIAEEIVDLYYRLAMSAGVALGIHDVGQRLAHKFLRDQLAQVRNSIFDRNVSETHSRTLDEIGHKLISVVTDEVVRDTGSFHTGVVFAGFGSEEVFPSCVELRLENLFKGMLKYSHGKTAKISLENTVTVLPFAQSDTVNLFMRGIADDYHGILLDSFVTATEHYTKDFMQKLPTYSKAEQDRIVQESWSMREEHGRVFREMLYAHSRNSYASEIMDVVSLLPEDQLAELAEALIDLTSMRRKLSFDEETVGGPTDVAVITKGDGMTWVRRKENIARDLNPNYYTRT